MKLGIIGDFKSSYKSHIATNEVIETIRPTLNYELLFNWIPTDSITDQFETITEEYNSFWIAPGSPYKNMDGVLQIIEYARNNNIPAFGNCGGFQHMVLEFTRNVLNVKDAEHAEHNPDASNLVITPLTCSIAGQRLEIEITDKNSKVYKAYGKDTILEDYHCNYGINPEYQNTIHENGFSIVGIDNQHEARILELKSHKFFIATLFVPQCNSSSDIPHVLIKKFLEIIGE